MRKIIRTTVAMRTNLLVKSELVASEARLTENCIESKATDFFLIGIFFAVALHLFETKRKQI